MKRISGIVICLLLLNCLGVAQDSLDEFTSWKTNMRLQLGTETQDSVRAKILAALSRRYVHRNPDSCIYYGTQAVWLARSTNQPEIEADILDQMGFSLAIMGNNAQAMKFLLEALQIGESIQVNEHIAGPLLHIAQVYRNTGEFEKAKTYALKALLYAMQQTEPKLGWYISHFNTGYIYSFLEQKDSSLYFFNVADQRLKQTAQSDPDFFELINGWYNAYIAYSYENLREYGMAIKHGRLTLYQSRPAGGNDRLFHVYSCLARSFNKINNPDSAVFYADRSLQTALESGIYSNMIRANRFLAELYSQYDLNKSFTYNQAALQYTDSLVARINSTTLQSFTDFDQRRRDYEIETAKISYQNKVRTFAFISGTAVLLIIATILFRNNRQKQRSNKILAGTLSNLRSTQSQLIHAEKMASLGELTAGIAHEIQNPLNFVNNFSEVSSEMIDEAKEELDKGDLQETKYILTDLKDNLGKINHHGQRASGIVKSMLDHSRAGSGEKAETDINALCDEYLRLAYHGMRARDHSFNAEFETHLDPDLPKIKVVPQDIGRVLLNLINNAFQACADLSVSAVDGMQKANGKEQKAPRVTITTRNKGDQIEIIVSDNGPGIPEDIRDKIFLPFFTTKPTGQGTGLGLSLSYDIVKAHGGDITLQSEEGEGSRFFITLPTIT